MSDSETERTVEKYESDIEVGNAIVAALATVKDGKNISAADMEKVHSLSAAWKRKISDAKRALHHMPRSESGSDGSIKGSFIGDVASTLGVGIDALQIALQLVNVVRGSGLSSAFIRNEAIGDALSKKTTPIFTVNAEAMLEVEQGLGASAGGAVMRASQFGILNIKGSYQRDTSLAASQYGLFNISGAAVPDSDGISYSVTCRQDVPDLDAMKVGNFENDDKVYLWEDKSVVTWGLIDDTFPDQDSFTETEKAMKRAVSAWNRVMKGRVTFRRVREGDKPLVPVVWFYGESGILATAPTPSDYGAPRKTVEDRKLKVYPLLFSTKTWISQAGNVLAHELGHVLGFRHQFALQREKQAAAGVVGEDRRKSVMGYKYPQFINSGDLRESRLVYDTLKDGELVELPTFGNDTIKLKVVRVAAFVPADAPTTG